MWVRALCLSALLLATAPGVAAAASPPAGSGVAVMASGASAQKLRTAIDTYLQPYRALDVFQGVVLVARGDQVLAEKAYGDASVELGVRNTPASVFRVASLTKVFTEVLLGRLEEEGRLDMSAPLTRYLPGFPHGDSITLDMLRVHRSGVPNMNSIPYDEEAIQPNTLDSLVRVIAKTPLDFSPGSRRRYSNGGYAVLAAVIEKVTGQRYADALAERVLRPLGLTHSYEEADGMLVPRRAYGYTASPRARHGLEVAPFQQMVTKSGGGSLVSTAGDLHRLLRAMYTDRPIQVETWRTLFPPDSVFSYQGRCPGYNVFMGRDFTRDVDVVVLCNNYAAGMVGDIGADLLAMASGREVAKPRWRADVPADSARVARFLGTYRPQPGALPYGDDPCTLKWRAGDLVLQIGSRPVDVLVPQGDDRYLLRNLWCEMRLVPEGPDRASSVTMRPLWFTTEARPLQRVP
jgi:CubicO group peptidase (beta-lactamase class C family)